MLVQEVSVSHSECALLVLRLRSTAPLGTRHGCAQPGAGRAITVICIVYCMWRCRPCRVKVKVLLHFSHHICACALTLSLNLYQYQSSQCTSLMLCVTSLTYKIIYNIILANRIVEELRISSVTLIRARGGYRGGPIFRGGSFRLFALRLFD